MPYCSECGNEYIDTVASCADCSAALKVRDSSADSAIECNVCGAAAEENDTFCWKCSNNLTRFDFDSKQPIHSNVLTQCESCKDYTSAHYEYCIECGYIRAGMRMCVNHPESMTRYVCLVCKKVLCKRCTVARGGKNFCKDDANYPFVGNWVIVQSDTHIEDLQPALQILESNEIFGVINDQMDRAQPYLAGQYALLVPIIHLRDAENILVREGLIFENMCMHCNHVFNGNPNRCPHCGEEFVF